MPLIQLFRMQGEVDSVGPEASWSHIMRFLGNKYFVCLCIFMCGGACTHMGCVCRGQRMILGAIIQVPSAHLAFEMEPLTDLELTD